MIKRNSVSLLAAALLIFTSLACFAEVVNINKADAAAFQQNLSGVGPVKAAAIVSYRNKNGAFKSIDDLKNVNGIGDELLKTNRQSMSLTSGVSTGKAKSAKSAEKSAKKSATDKEAATKTKAEKDAAKKVKDKKS